MDAKRYAIFTHLRKYFNFKMKKKATTSPKKVKEVIEKAEEEKKEVKTALKTRKAKRAARKGKITWRQR